MSVFNSQLLAHLEDLACRIECALDGDPKGYVLGVRVDDVSRAFELAAEIRKAAKDARVELAYEEWRREAAQAIEAKKEPDPAAYDGAHDGEGS